MPAALPPLPPVPEELPPFAVPEVPLVPPLPPLPLPVPPFACTEVPQVPVMVPPVAPVPLDPPRTPPWFVSSTHLWFSQMRPLLQSVSFEHPPSSSVAGELEQPCKSATPATKGIHDQRL